MLDRDEECSEVGSELRPCDFRVDGTSEKAPNIAALLTLSRYGKERVIRTNCVRLTIGSNPDVAPGSEDYIVGRSNSRHFRPVISSEVGLMGRVRRVPCLEEH